VYAELQSYVMKFPGAYDRHVPIGSSSVRMKLTLLQQYIAWMPQDGSRLGAIGACCCFTAAAAAAVLSDEVPLVVSRQLLATFAQETSKLPAEVHKAVAMQ
jgi:hypothetical protein